MNGSADGFHELAIGGGVGHVSDFEHVSRGDRVAGMLFDVA